MKSRGFLTLACASCLAVLSPPVPPARAAVGLTGVVRSVNVEGRKLVIMPIGSESEVTVTVMDQARITTEQGLPLRLADLKRNDNVGIAHQNGIATSIVVNQVPLLGLVSTIDPDGKTLVVTEKGSNRDVTVRLNDTTTIVTGGGRQLGLKDLKTGDGVAITYAGPKATRIAVNEKPPELTGHVKEVDADLKSLVITEIGTNNVVKIAVDSNTTIITGQGKTLSLKDLKKGDGVGVAHDGSVASKIVVNAASAR
jgi:hypothetical protein